MNKFLTLFSLLCLWACQAPQEEVPKTDETVHFDSTAANALGADDYGMKTYVMALLKTGDSKAKDSAHAAELMQAHLANISRLAKNDLLVLAGPFMEGDSLRGIYIFDTKSLDSARKWTATDPAIQYGIFKMELIKWYGSAALMKVNEIHQSIAKQSI